MLKLRDYQLDAIEKVRQSLRSGHKRPLLVLPTGAGKSPIMSQIAKNTQENGKRVLFWVHRRNLIFQLAEMLRSHYDIEPGIIMSGCESNFDRQIQLASIQTFSRRAGLDEKYFNSFIVDADVILIDECHRTISKTYKDSIDLYSDKIIVGVTATPCKASGQGMGEVFDDLIVGPSIKELTDQKYLAPLRYFVPARIDLDGVKIVMGDYQTKSLEEKTNKKKLIGDIIENWLKCAENRKTLVFCVNVKHAIAVCDAFNEAGIPAEHLNARSSDEERQAVFDSMERGNTQVVTNVALYQEGLDVPSVSCIVMARPTKSMGLYRQCVGRGMRPEEGKTCIVMDHGNIIEEHGLLEWDIEWTLDGTKRAWSKPRRDTVRKLVRCRACGLTFEGTNTCPDCGTKVKTFGQKIATIDAELEEIKPEKGSVIEKREFLGMLKAWVPRQKNPNPKRILGAFRGRYGVFPHGSYSNVSPISPDQKFLNYMKSQAIRWAKRKQLDTNSNTL